MVLGHDILTSERTQDIKISEDVSFDSMLLSPDTLNGLKTSGFYVPSPIQLHGIPLGKCGFDLLLEAKSGTGKTAVFSVIALEKLDLNSGVQTLVLAPTREIASQICDVIRTIGAYFEGLSVEVVMGGLPFEEDVEKFKKKVHIVVGSPGRLHYLIHGKHIDVSSVRLMVLDEADKLVEKSFLSDINYIFSVMPSQKQIIMSSATFPENVKTIMNNYVQNAHHICPDTSSVLLGIEQNVTVVPSHVNIVKQTKNKYEELHSILSKKQFKQCLIFCNYQVRVVEVHRMLKKDKWPADKLYGKQEQIDRLEALKILQDYQCRILVTTDLTARGIDASNVDLVINFEKPQDWQTYLHRIGRAGRFGSYGSAITILSEGAEIIKFKELLRSINIPFDLKYLWTKEHFLLDNENPTKREVFLKKEETKESETKEPKEKLGIKETFKELWKILSVDPTQTKQKEILDIPTFESLCESFEKADTDLDKIESFSDLMTSFQNHEIKNEDKINYNPVEVNKLIIPHTIFNRNVVLQSFQNYKRVVSPVNIIDNNYKCEKANGSKDDNSTKSNKINGISKSGNTENDDTSVSDKESVKNNNIEKESCNNKYNENASGSHDHQSETIHDDLCLSTASTSSTCKIKAQSTSKKSTNNHSKRLIENKENACGSQDHWAGTIHDDFPIDSTSSTCKTDTKISSKKSKTFIENKSQMPNKTVPKKNIRDVEESHNKRSHYIDNAIGINDHPCTELNDEEKTLLLTNLPIAFGKSMQNHSKSKRHPNVSQKKLNSTSKHIECEIQLPKPTYNDKQRYSDNESADAGIAEDKCVPYKSNKGKKSKSKNKQNVSNNHSTLCNDDGDNYSIQKRQQEFDLWYHKLHQHMEMIERHVYNEEMGKTNFISF